MTQQIPITTYQSSIEVYFGGIQNLAKQKLPFTCKCGDTTYPRRFTDELGIKSVINEPMMHVEDIYKHIRRVHKERIKKTV